MMRADYDSEADALSIDLREVDRWQGAARIDDSCHVALVDGAPVNVELLYPRDHLRSLDVVATRYALDGGALVAAAEAALAVPDREVRLDIAAPAAA